jgi:hypothetical protein
MLLFAASAALAPVDQHQHGGRELDARSGDRLPLRLRPARGPRDRIRGDL